MSANLRMKTDIEPTWYRHSLLSSMPRAPLAPKLGYRYFADVAAAIHVGHAFNSTQLANI